MLGRLVNFLLGVMIVGGGECWSVNVWGGECLGGERLTINCFTMKISRFNWCLKEIGLEYIFFFCTMKYLFQPFLGNIKHDLRRAAGPPNKGDNLFHSCRLH